MTKIALTGIKPTGTPHLGNYLGLLNRAHAYQAAVEENLSAGKSADANIRAGLYNYPVWTGAK